MKKHMYLALIAGALVSFACSDQSSLQIGGGKTSCQGDDCKGSVKPCEGDDCGGTAKPCEGDDCGGTSKPCEGDDCEDSKPAKDPCDGIDLMTSADNCGKCGFSCDGGTCKDGKCACNEGWLDCDGDGSCESEGACNCTKGETQPCYEGPEDTENVGICKSGTMTCDGVLWGECVGQVTPLYNACLADPEADADCNGVPDVKQDEDGDGYSVCDGTSTQRYDCCDSVNDCNTSSPQLVNPGKTLDCKGNGIDDDCDGQIDEDDVSCDGTSGGTTDTTSCLLTDRDCSAESDYVPAQSFNPWDGGFSTAADKKEAARALAKAMDMCMEFGIDKNSTSAMGGIIEYYVQQSDSFGSAVDSMQINVLSGLYPATSSGQAILPRVGKTFAVLSSGWAIDAKNGVKNDQELGNLAVIPEPYRSAHNGMLQSHKYCKSASRINDSVRFHLKIKAPDTAKGFSFDFRFLTQEYPQYVCSEYNDFFLALLTDENGKALEGVNADGNISFDELGNPISVNNAFFMTCESISCGWGKACPNNLTCSSNACNSCPDGYAELYAYSKSPYNGYSGKAGGTAWLTTTAPVTPGLVFNLDFYIWDTGDRKFDSSVLLDNFQWSCDETTVSTGFAQSGGGVN